MKRTNKTFTVALILSVMLDLLDIFVLGLIPIAGDFLDLFGVVVLWFLIGAPSLLGLIELIPVMGDVFPTFVTATILGFFGSALWGRKK